MSRPNRRVRLPRASRLVLAILAGLLLTGVATPARADPWIASSLIFDSDWTYHTHAIDITP